MPRILTLQFKDVEIPVTLKKFSREMLYGKSLVEKRGERGEVYSNAILTQDGTHILPNRAIGSQYVDPEGNFQSETVLVDSDGKAVPVARSMFKTPVKLTKTISFDTYFSYNIEYTYLLVSESKQELESLYQACTRLLQQNKLYRFTYAYYDTTNPRDAILLPKDEHLFLAVGELAELIMLKPTQILYSEVEEEELEEEISFEVW